VAWRGNSPLFKQELSRQHQEGRSRRRRRGSQRIGSYPGGHETQECYLGETLGRVEAEQTVEVVRNGEGGT
jgi:hypothetical protein